MIDETEGDQDLFAPFEGDFLEFHKIKTKRANRPDLHAFLLLDELCPGTSDIISAAAHDEIFLDVDVDELRKKATEEQLRELHRCGVRHDADHESLVMFA